MNRYTTITQALNVATNARLAAIVSATNELNRCMAQYREATTTEERVGIFLGEMDWRRELERLLYETV